MDQKGPTFDKYELYYRQIVSPIATDGVDSVVECCFNLMTLEEDRVFEYQEKVCIM